MCSSWLSIFCLTTNIDCLRLPYHGGITQEVMKILMNLLIETNKRRNEPAQMASLGYPRIEERIASHHAGNKAATRCFGTHR